MTTEREDWARGRLVRAPQEISARHNGCMRCALPNHVVGPWVATPWWVAWRSTLRRRNWRWTIDHLGCRCVSYWEYWT